MTQKHECSDQRLTRRQVLHACGATALGVGLTGSLQAKPGGTRSPLQVKNLLWIQVNGGLSHLDTFDPKPGTRSGSFPSRL